jgi:hypothetical protein
MPRRAMEANQTSITGPKSRPMPAVPRLCTRKRPSRMTMVSGTTSGSAARVATESPSTAESTEMAGVMVPSPKRSAAPKRAAMTTGVRRPDRDARGDASARRAKMPPSPRLSAERMKTTYLTVTTAASDQKTSDSTARMLSAEAARP